MNKCGIRVDNQKININSRCSGVLRIVNHVKQLLMMCRKRPIDVAATHILHQQIRTIRCIRQIGILKFCLIIAYIPFVLKIQIQNLMFSFSCPPLLRNYHFTCSTISGGNSRCNTVRQSTLSCFFFGIQHCDLPSNQNGMHYITDCRERFFSFSIKRDCSPLEFSFSHHSAGLEWINSTAF